MTHSVLRVLLSFLPRIHGGIRRRLIKRGPRNLISLVRGLRNDYNCDNIPHVGGLYRLVRRRLHDNAGRRSLRPRLLRLLSRVSGMTHRTDGVLKWQASYQMTVNFL